MWVVRFTIDQKYPPSSLVDVLLRRHCSSGAHLLVRSARVFRFSSTPVLSDADMDREPLLFLYHLVIAGALASVRYHYLINCNFHWSHFPSLHYFLASIPLFFLSYYFWAFHFLGFHSSFFAFSHRRMTSNVIGSYRFRLLHSP